jgi:hypothetical protein
VEDWLNLFSHHLLSTGKDIRDIETQNKGFNIATKNQKVLKEHLGMLLQDLELSDETVSVLQNASLETLVGIKDLEEATQKVQNAMKTNTNEKLKDMFVVKERIGQFGEYCNQFSSRFVIFLKDLIKVYCDQALKNDVKFAKRQPLILSSYLDMEESLLQYRNLVSWLKEIDPRQHMDVQVNYVELISQVHKRELKHLLDFLRMSYIERKTASDELEYGIDSFTYSAFSQNSVQSVMKATSQAALNATKPLSISILKESTLSRKTSVITDSNRESLITKLGRPRKISSNNSNAFQTASTMSRIGLDSMPNEISDDKLSVEGMVCLLVFILEGFLNFFEFLTKTITKHQNFLMDFLCLPQCTPLNTNVSILLNSLDIPRNIQLDLRASKKLEESMSNMFPGLHLDIISLIDYIVKYDNSASLGILVSLEKSWRKSNFTNYPFLNSTFEQIKDKLVSIFQKYCAEQVAAVEDYRVNVKKRSGLISFTKVYPRFVRKMEIFMKGVDPEYESRKLLKDMYDRLSKAVSESLNAFAKEIVSDDKEQLNAHILLLENMHHFYTELRGQKVVFLEPFIKYAKSQYDLQLSAYIKAVVRRPLGKMLEFFEGIEDLLKTKTPDEIGFHISYNRAALKKVVSSLPGKEVIHCLILVEKIS